MNIKNDVKRPVKHLSLKSRVLGLGTQVLGLWIQVLVLVLEPQVLVNITGATPAAVFLKTAKIMDQGFLPMEQKS